LFVNHARETIIVPGAPSWKDFFTKRAPRQCDRLWMAEVPETQEQFPATALSIPPVDESVYP